MIRSLDGTLCIDRDRIFMSGFSMGDYLTDHLGCVRPDLARAIVAHSAGTHSLDSCSVGADSVVVRGGRCEWNQGVPRGGAVLCLFEGMRHGWAGHDGPNGGGSQYEDATTLAWEFFKKQ
jgi:poly(3-hydroxybutyrate) depolymerase